MCVTAAMEAMTVMAVMLGMLSSAAVACKWDEDATEMWPRRLLLSSLQLRRCHRVKSRSGTASAGRVRSDA